MNSSKIIYALLKSKLQSIHCGSFKCRHLSKSSLSQLYPSLWLSLLPGIACRFWDSSCLELEQAMTFPPTSLPGPESEYSHSVAHKSLHALVVEATAIQMTWAVDCLSLGFSPPGAVSIDWIFHLPPIVQIIRRLRSVHLSIASTTRNVAWILTLGGFRRGGFSLWRLWQLGGRRGKR